MTDPPAWFIFLCGVWTGVFSLAVLIRIAQSRRQPSESRLSSQRRA